MVVYFGEKKLRVKYEGVEEILKGIERLIWDINLIIYRGGLMKHAMLCISIVAGIG